MMNMKKNIILFAFLFVGVLTGYCQQSAYLFVYFTGNRMSEEAVRMAVSLDGYNYKALNGNQPVLDSRVISSTGGVRDPHIQSPNQKIPDRKTKCVIKTHINIKQNVIFGAKLKPV